MDKETRLLLDASCKYTVLLIFTLAIVVYAGFNILGKEINLPDWIVMLFTIVFQYFFRRSPKEADNVETNQKLGNKDIPPSHT